MNMDLVALETIARSVVDKPWGLGLSHLNNAESSAPYYRFLYAVVEKYRPFIALECGTYLGVATEHMALGSDSTYVISIDKELRVEPIDVARRYTNVKLIHGDTVSLSVSALVEWMCTDANCRIGLLFLDSEHDGKTPRAEFDTYFHLFDSECLVVCDDILDPRMKEFWDWMPGDKGEMHFLHPSQYPGLPEPGFGISIIRKDFTNA